MPKIKSWMTILVLIILLQACIPGIQVGNNLDEPEDVSPTETTSACIAPTETALPTDTPEPTPTPDPLADCPTPTEGTTQYISRENGICLLYPTYFEQSAYYEHAEERLHLLGPLLDPNAMETFRVTLTIEFNGPAGDLDSFQYALKWKEYFYEWVEPERETGFIGGQPAVTFTGLPSYAAAEQSAFIIANGFKYRIMLSPEIGSVPELDDHAVLLWETVTHSIIFFTPENNRPYTSAEEVCPQPNAEFKQYIHPTDGYCLLYPADFEEAPDFPGEIQGGPILEYGTSWGDIRTSLTMGTWGYYPDTSIMELMDTDSPYIDQSTIVETTMGGFPAVHYRNPGGPWASHDAKILVDDFVYTIVAQPWEPDRFPEGIPYLARLWDTVTSSLTFFDPWR